VDSSRVAQTLRLIGKVYGRLLDDTTRAVVLPQAEARIRASATAYADALRNSSRGVVPQPWGYTIEHDQPLRFVVSKVNRIELQADVYCDVRWEESDLPVVQEIKLRLWSRHSATTFNPERDAVAVEQELTNPSRRQPGRVVSRMHFDKANPQQPGPEYHLQFGGKAEEYELCWHPESVKVPRFDYQPMELFLTCQLVAANLFPEEYQEIREKSEWREELLWYQGRLLLGHYEKRVTTLRANTSLLDSLWMS